MNIAGSPTNPFQFSETSLPSYSTIGSRALRSPRLAEGESTGVFIVAGQSNAANHSPASLYTATHAAKIDNLNISDGGLYEARDPALGASGSGTSWLLRFSDLLIAQGFYGRMIIVPIAVGATSVTDWAPGGGISDRIPAAVGRLANVGLQPSAILWQQGEADTAMTQSAYAASLSGVIALSRSVGVTAPWLLGKSIYNAGATSTAVRAAITAAVNGEDVLAGADTDTLTGATYREPSLVHFNEAGVSAAANLWKTAVVEALAL